jgi:hypothetical protein
MTLRQRASSSLLEKKKLGWFRNALISQLSGSNPPRLMTRALARRNEPILSFVI